MRARTFSSLCTTCALPTRLLCTVVPTSNRSAPLELTCVFSAQSVRCTFHVFHGSSANGVLIDGFPRDVTQAESFTRDVAQFEFALYFDCPKDELMRRLLKRGESSGRTDDNLNSIRKRFTTFERDCKPVVDLYSTQGKIVTIDALRDEDAIFAEICPLFENAVIE